MSMAAPPPPLPLPHRHRHCGGGAAAVDIFKKVLRCGSGAVAFPTHSGGSGAAAVNFYIILSIFSESV